MLASFLANLVGNFPPDLCIFLTTTRGANAVAFPGSGQKSIFASLLKGWFARRRLCSFFSLPYSKKS